MSHRSAEEIGRTELGPRPLPPLGPSRNPGAPPAVDTVLDNGLRVLAVRRPAVPMVELRLRIPFLSGAASHPARAAVLSDALLTGAGPYDRAGLAAAILLTSCAATSGSGHAVAGTRTTRPAAAPATSPQLTVPLFPAPAGVTATPTSASPTSARPATAASRPTELPRGGRQILGHYRSVAYYGGPDGPALGVLGSAPPEQIAAAIERAAARFAGGRLPVQPAMELIASVAQGSPGRDGNYSATIPDRRVERYLAVAHRHHMLLILDFQPGRGEFLPQVRQFAAQLADPAVSVALDPEWKMAPGQVPGTVIGSASAASIDAVRDYLADLVATRHLPDKLLIVQQFTLAMLPDRQRITPRPGIELTFHADGFGTRPGKLATWRALDFPGRPFGAGFKLFLRQDSELMTPAQVLALRPRPDVITFQ